jgi:hypothetical protein
VIWAEECRDAPEDLEDPTAALAYLAKNLTPKGGAEVKTVSGAEVVQHNALTAGWVTVLESPIASVGHMSHRGPRRMWFRVEDPGEELDNVQLQLLYRSLGASKWEDRLSIVSSPVVGAYQLVDLGLCRPQRAVIGSDRWEWKLMARAVSGSGTIRIRDVYPLPTEQYLQLTQPYAPAPADLFSTKAPGTMEDETGIGTVAWKNPANAEVSDGTYAEVALDEGEVSHYLRAKDFAFGLPEGVTVTGLVAAVEKSTYGGGKKTMDAGVYIHTHAKPVGVNHASPDLWSYNTDTVTYYGGAEDTWGFTGAAALTAADINDSRFGVAIAAKGKGTARVDAVTLTVYYTEAESEDRVCYAERSIDLRSDGIYRQHRDDEVWGRVIEDGFPPVATPGGLEELPRRGIVIASEGDVGELPDSAATLMSLGNADRPGYFFARESADS